MSDEQNKQEPLTQVTDADLIRVEDWLMTRSGNAAFIPVDATNLANMAMLMSRELRQRRAGSITTTVGERQHLWGIVSEECHEITLSASAVGQLAIKILRFGEITVSPDGKTIYKNVEDLVREANDLLAVLEMLQEAGVEMPTIMDREQMDKKKAKVRAFMEHSRKLGLLK